MRKIFIFLSAIIVSSSSFAGQVENALISDSSSNVHAFSCGQGNVDATSYNRSDRVWMYKVTAKKEGLKLYLILGAENGNIMSVLQVNQDGTEFFWKDINQESKSVKFLIEGSNSDCVEKVLTLMGTSKR